MKTNSKKTSEVKFNVELDENLVPEYIEWFAEGSKKSSCKAMMTSIWDDAEKNTLRIDLWTKDMTIEEMRHFCVQSLITMADTYEKATSDKSGADEMRKFGKNFGQNLGVIAG